MAPDPTRLVTIGGIKFPLIGFYDAPDPTDFEPLVEPVRNEQVCIFSFFEDWRKDVTLHLTRENYGCGGAGRSLCGATARSHEDFITFLVDGEGLKASRELMKEWLAHDRPYRARYDHLFIGPVRDGQYDYLRSVTFFVNPDQLGLLMYGAQYHARPTDPRPVLAPFGSGCMQLVTLFEDLNIAQAVVGATDIAMRKHLPADILAFTVTKPMYERLCSLDERSFLYKPFWKTLQEARGKA